MFDYMLLNTLRSPSMQKKVRVLPDKLNLSSDVRCGICFIMLWIEDAVTEMLLKSRAFSTNFCEPIAV